jgi:phosphoglycerate dehydrogenase-like enzyme
VSGRTDPPVVLVTEPEFRRAEAAFSGATGLRCTPAPPGETELAHAVAEAGTRYVIVGSHRYTSGLYDALPRGGVIARFGVGHDSVDKAKATQAGLLCTNTPGVLDESVAEHAILLMLGAARHFAANTAEMRGGTWNLGPQGLELRGKTLAIIGLGRIGLATARIAARGFGMRVVGMRRTPAGAPPEDSIERVTTDFESAVHDADFVSLHLNAEPANRRFVNAERLAMMSPRAWLVNTARGAVVDEDALYEAVAARRIGGAALDVFEREPYVPSDPSRDFRTLPNVVLTAHVGSHTAEANRGMAERAMQNIRLAQAGDFGSMDLLNPEVLINNCQ